MTEKSKLEKPKSKIVIGLVGQVCSGKSAVAEAFRKRGARVYDADHCVHEIYKQPEAIAQVAGMFGPEVLDEMGAVSRKALGRIVFADPAQLDLLTSKVIYPRTAEIIAREIEAFRLSDAPAMVLNAPTLFEAGREGFCDFIVFVTAPAERRRTWAQARGWQPGDLELREARMCDEAEKRHRSDAVIDNAGSQEELDRKAGELLERWCGAGAGADPAPEGQKA